MSLFLQTSVFCGICSIPANPVSTGVCHEQDRNYLSGTHAAGRAVFPGDRSRWFPLFQRTGRPRPGHRQGGRGGHCGTDGARPPEPLGGSQGGRQEFLCGDVRPHVRSACTYERHNYRPCTPDRTWSSAADTRTDERPSCSNCGLRPAETAQTVVLDTVATLRILVLPCERIDPSQQYLTANSDRLSQFGRRISLFLQTLVLRGILSSEQEHRQEHMNP